MVSGWKQYARIVAFVIWDNEGWEEGISGGVEIAGDLYAG